MLGEYAMKKIKAIGRPILFGFLYIISILFFSAIGSALNFSEVAINLTIQLGLMFEVLLLAKAVKKEYGINVKEHLNFKMLKFSKLYLFIISAITIELCLIQLEAIVKNQTNLVDSTANSYDNATIMVLYLFGIFVAPVTEEILCRIIMIESCKKEIGVVFSVILSSLIFSFLHLRGLIPTIHIFTTSLLLGYIYVKTNNLAYTIIIHSTTNTLLIIFDLLYECGIPVYKSINGNTVINSYVLAVVVILTAMSWGCEIIKKRRIN